MPGRSSVELDRDAALYDEVYLAGAPVAAVGAPDLPGYLEASFFEALLGCVVEGSS